MSDEKQRKTEVMRAHEAIRLPQDRPYITETATMVCENGNTYEVKANGLIGYGGEALVYKVSKPESSDEFPNGFIAKLNDQAENTFSAIRTRANVVKFLSKVRETYKESHIAPLIDTCSFSYTFEGIGLTKNVDFYPVCESCEGKKFSYSELREKIIPQLLMALNVMHSAYLVHRDIKPGNIYLLNGDYYLADFGTASVLDVASGKDTDERVGQTLLLRATRGYMAPEVAMNAFYTATDYYSFGCAIATLYKGKHVYQNLLNDPALLNIEMAKGLPLDCKKGEEDLQLLVNALILRDYAERPKYEDVLLWLNEPEKFKEKFQKIIERVPEQTNPGYIVSGETRCYKSEELVQELLSHWEDAKRHLYSGGTSSPLIVYYRTQNQAIATELAKIVEEDNDTLKNYRLGLARALYFIFQSSTEYYWEGVAYLSLADIAKTVDKGKSVCLEGMLKDKYLSWILTKRKKPGDTSVSDEYKDILEAEKLYDNGLVEIAVEYFVCAFGEGDAVYEKCTDEAEVFAFLSSKHGHRIYDICEKKPLENSKLFAFLAYLRSTKVIMTLISAWKSDTANDDIALIKGDTKPFTDDAVLFNVILLFEFFESICDMKEVRKAYLNCGAYSMQYWLQNNIDYYFARKSEGNMVIGKISSKQLTTDESIVDLNKELYGLEKLQDDLIANLENPFMACYNISDNSKGIVPKNSDALFVERFYGKRVTTGYLRHMELI